MKIKSLVITAVLVTAVLCSAGSVYANWNSQQKIITVPIKKGWNLVPGCSFELINSASTIKIADFKYVFFFDRNSSKYYLTMKDGVALYDANQEITSSYTQDDYMYLIQSSFWVYSEKEGDLVLNWGNQGFNNEIFRLPNYKLKKGWNFIFITPEFLGKSFDEVKGNCEIQRVHYWTPEYPGDNKWTENARLTDMLNSNVGVGLGVVIKVANNCNLNFSETDITPPPIPN